MGPSPHTDPGPYRRLVERHLPFLRGYRCRPIDSGWGCFVLDINNEWIARFPRTADDARAVEVEERLLAELETRLPVPVPHYEHTVRDSRGRLRLVAYPKIRGRPLPTRNLWGPEAERWASGLVEMLHALDRFPRTLGRRLGIAGSDGRDRKGPWTALYPIVRARVHPLLPERIRALDSEYWERFLREESSLRALPVLTHGDLFPHHVLVDDHGLAGVLDWESAGYADPVGDVTGLPDADGFQARVSLGYLGDDPSIGARLAFHRHAVPVHSLRRGLDTRDPKMVRSALHSYIRTLPRSNHAKQRPGSKPAR